MRNPQLIFYSMVKTESFSSKIRIRQEYLLLPFLFNIVMEVLSTAIREEEERRAIQVGREVVKLALFTDDMVVSTKNH